MKKSLILILIVGLVALTSSSALATHGDSWYSSKLLGSTTALAEIYLTYPDAECAMNTQAHLRVTTYDAWTNPVDIDRIGFSYELVQYLAQDSLEEGALYKTPGASVIFDSDVHSPIDEAHGDFAFETSAIQWYPSHTVGHCARDLVNLTKANVATQSRQLLAREDARVLSKYSKEGEAVSAADFIMKRVKLIKNTTSVSVGDTTFRRSSPSTVWLTVFELPSKAQYQGGTQNMRALILIDVNTGEEIVSVESYKDSD